MNFLDYLKPDTLARMVADLNEEADAGNTAAIRAQVMIHAYLLALVGPDVADKLIDQAANR